MKSRNPVIPQICHDFDIRISRDGTWLYHGTPVKRPELVRLFAGILKRDQEGIYWLETPYERGRITVEDAPFIIVGLRTERSGQDRQLVFETNTGEEVILSDEYPLYFVAREGETIPYIAMRNNLSARISRSVFYQLVDEAEVVDIEGKPEWQIHSNGYSFSLGRNDE
jgi:hypothetical protein